MDTELGNSTNLVAFLAEKLLAYFDPRAGHVVSAELVQEAGNLALRFSLCLEGLTWHRDQSWTAKELTASEYSIGELVEQELRKAVAEAGY